MQPCASFRTFRILVQFRGRALRNGNHVVCIQFASGSSFDKFIHHVATRHEMSGLGPEGHGIGTITCEKDSSTEKSAPRLPGIDSPRTLAFRDKAKAGERQTDNRITVTHFVSCGRRDTPRRSVSALVKERRGPPRLMHAAMLTHLDEVFWHASSSQIGKGDPQMQYLWLVSFRMTTS